MKSFLESFEGLQYSNYRAVSIRLAGQTVHTIVLQHFRLQCFSSESVKACRIVRTKPYTLCRLGRLCFGGVRSYVQCLTQKLHAWTCL